MIYDGLTVQRRLWACVGIRSESWYIHWYSVAANKMDTNMPLTDMEVRSAKPGARLVKLSDGGGLQLWIMPDGAKRWRLAYRFAGGQKLLAIGVYPATGLREAREAREDAKRLLADGKDPYLAKKLANSALIFDRTGNGAYPRQVDPRMTLQKLPRVKCGSLSASTSVSEVLASYWMRRGRRFQPRPASVPLS